MKNSVLVLNTDYSPHDIWEWQHAMTKFLCTNSVRAVFDENGMVKHDFVVRDGQGNKHELPAVLVLTKDVKAHHGMAPYTKLNIYARDMWTCQYCGTELKDRECTIDHVIPRAHWNPRRFHFRLSSFENVVTSCGPCNKIKRNQTPQQAGMKLIRKPRRISRAAAYTNKLNRLKNKPVQWIPYLKVENVAQT
jgi:hypothetical protein